jgi:ABC-2 type transport system ATP-binding protein
MPTTVEPPAIVIQGVNKLYGTHQALHNLSLTVEKGTIFGFLGPNGSGKSTTIKILCGLVEATAGDAWVLGRNVKTGMDEIRHQIGYMSQQFSLYDDLTAFQNLRFYSGLYGISGHRFRQRVDEIIALLKIEPYLDRKAGVLSGGWKQRLALGCAIIHEPPVIFLDEPTAGIDPVARRDLWDLLFDLSSQGFTLFVTTHYMDEAERCQRVAYIFEGRLIANGTSNELRQLDVVTPIGARRLEVVCAPLMPAYRLLSQHTDILDVTIFGTRLHMMIFNRMSDTMLTHFLNQWGITVQRMAVVDPSLEDVFVTLTQHAIAQRSGE